MQAPGTRSLCLPRKTVSGPCPISSRLGARLRRYGPALAPAGSYTCDDAEWRTANRAS